MEVKVQDNVTASPLDAWSSAGVLTLMEETGEGAGGEIGEQKRRKKMMTELQRTGMKEKRGWRGKERERRTHGE